MLKFIKSKAAIFGFAIALTFVGATSASALTQAEATALIAALNLSGSQAAAVQALVSGGSEGKTYNFGSVTLKQGSSGSAVMELQKYLGITADGAFGPMTKAAVMSWQAQNGLTADGAFGPMSMAKANSMMVGGGSGSSGSGSGSSGSGSSSSLGGDEGELDSFDEISSADSTITEGEENEVFAFTFEVEGDVSVDRVDFYMEIDDSTTASDNPDDYFSSATLLVDGDEVATVDVDDFGDDDYAKIGTSDDGTTADDEYRIRFSGLDLVFSDGDEPEFSVAFEVNDSIDSDDINNGDWIIALDTDSIRFVDGKGFSSETGPGASIFETFGAESEEAAELTVKSSSDDLDASVIETSTSAETEKETIFVFEIEEENDVDATINDLTVTITTLTSAGAGTDESTVVTDAFLYNGSTLLGSESVTSGGAVSFESLNLDIDGGDTVELTLKVTIADADDFAAGNTISATITGSSDIDDAEDANGNDEGDMTLGGSATSESHSLRTEGLMVEFVGSSYTKTSSDTSGVNETVEFVLTFKATAFGDDIFVDNECAFDDDGTYDASVVSVSLDGDADGDNTTCTDIDSTGDEETEGFEILEGQTETFTVTVLGNGGEGAGAGNPATFRARINNIGYNVGADGEGDTSYNFDMSNYKSGAVTVYDR